MFRVRSFYVGTNIVIGLIPIGVTLELARSVGSSAPYRDIGALMFAALVALLSVEGFRAHAIALSRGNWRAVRPLQRGEVIRAAAVYLLLAWVLLSAADYIFEGEFGESAPNPTGQAFQEGSGGDRVGLALSGGGFRAALFHAGVLEELEELQVQPRVMSSVSGGSIIGAFYARGGKPEEFVHAVENGRFNLERGALRIDNVLRLSGAVLRTLRIPGTALRPFGFLPDFDTTHLEAELLDRQLFHGVLAREGSVPGRPELMLCVTDITAPDMMGITRNGSVIRHITDSLGRIPFENPTGMDESGTYIFAPSSAIPMLPGSERLSSLVAASGAFPGAFAAYQTMGMGNMAQLADGGLSDNYGVVLLEVAQYLVSENEVKGDIHLDFPNPGPEWNVNLILVSDGSALSPVSLPSGVLSDLSRSADVVYEMTGGPQMFVERMPDLDARKASAPRLLLLSPRAITLPEYVLRVGESPTQLGYERQSRMTQNITAGKAPGYVGPLNILDLSRNAWDAIAREMPPDKRERAKGLIMSLSDAGKLGPAGLQGTGIDRGTPEWELYELLKNELDRCLLAFIDAKTLKDHFSDSSEPRAIYQLGRYIVRLNESYLTSELARARKTESEANSQSDIPPGEPGLPKGRGLHGAASGER